MTLINSHHFLTLNMRRPNEGCFVGTMPPQDFLDTFLNVGHELATTPNGEFSKVAPGEDVCYDMCTPFIRAVKKFKLGPGLRFFVARTKRRWNEKLSDVDDRGEGNQGTRAASDLCASMSVRREPSSRGQQKKSKSIAEYYTFATSLLGIEVRHAPDADPFADPEDYEPSRPPSRQSPSGSAPRSPLSNHLRTPPKPPVSVSQGPRTVSPLNGTGGASPKGSQRGQPSVLERHEPDSPVSRTSSNSSYHNPVERETEEGTAFRLSLVSHAQAQFARQHRSFFFQLVLVNRWARFVRWDRSGAVVSARFNYIHEPRLLAEFIWRFAHMSDVQRGLDPTVTTASKMETMLFQREMEDFLDNMNVGSKEVKSARHLPGAEISLDPSGTYPTWKVHVVNETSGDSSDFIVRRPFAGHSSLFGRATRAYVAYDLCQQRLVFLKDAWRIDNPKLQAEFKTYQALQQHGVPYVPDVFYGGDVTEANGEVQQTLSQDYATIEAEWRMFEGPLARHIHHRLVQDIAYPLESALNEKEFVQAIHDVCCAMSVAHDVAGLLHRDLSISNVMIDSRGRGLLNDWDHAGQKDDEARGIGTWRFMPIALLEDAAKVHDIADDLESVFWIFLYGALTLFAPSDQDRFKDLFDYQTVDPKSRRRWGGQMKHGYISGSRLLDTRFTAENLQKLVEQARWMWHGFYMAQQGGRTLESFPEVKADLMEKRKRASTPSFWIDMFAKTLRDMDAQQDDDRVGQASADSTRVSPPCVLRQDASLSLSTQASRKRKSHDDLHPTNSDGIALHRFKRLRPP